MSHTIKPVSPARTQEEDTDDYFPCYKAVKEAKTDAKDNLHILASLYDSTSNLCSSLDRLDTFMESIIFDKEKEKSSPQAGLASFRGNASMVR